MTVKTRTGNVSSSRTMCLVFVCNFKTFDVSHKQITTIFEYEWVSYGI